MFGCSTQVYQLLLDEILTFFSSLLALYWPSFESQLDHAWSFLVFLGTIFCRLLTLGWHEIWWIRITICHTEDRSQSNGLHLRYEETIEVLCNILKFVVILHTGSTFQEVLHCQWCVELWSCDVWDMESGTQTIWGLHKSRGKLPWASPYWWVMLASLERQECSMELY